MRNFLLTLGFITFLLPLGCKDDSQSQSSQPVGPIKLMLNWQPEPEFGGFYAAQSTDAFKKRELEVEIVPGGAGSPVVQMVESGQATFGIASADEVVIARSRGADLVAVFAVYQTCPQGVMTHEARGFDDIQQVLQSEGTLAMEPGLPYVKFLQEKYGTPKAKVVPYTGGVAQFLNDPNFSQQCFIFSEPIIAKQQGATPEVFLVADAGYNPYTAVVIARGDFVRQHPGTVKSFVEASREGWQAYLDDPKPANELMENLNRTMDAPTFAAGAEAQEPLIETDHTRQHGLGAMTAERWQVLCEQMSKLGIVDRAPAPEQCFVDVSRFR